MRLDNAKILISDDSILARKQLKDFISKYGTPTFFEASNGQDAIDIYKKEKPDLSFLDIVMPIKDGNAAIREIIDFDKDAEIIIVSSVGTQSQLRSAIEAGAKDFIQKPLNPEQLHSILTSRFEGRSNMYAQFFGTFLLSHNVVTKDQLLSALGKKSSQHMKLGTLAIMKGYMTANEVDNVIISQTHNDCRFGDLAVREGYLTQEQVDELVKTQYPDFLLLGQTLVEEGYITNTQLETLIADYESENELTDLDYSNEKQDDLDRILANFFHSTDVAADEYNASYMRLLFNDLTRFIGDDFTPLCFNPCKEYPVNYCVSQTIHGDLSAKVYLDMPETTCISFASRYVNEEFTEFDEYVQASLEDFLNLHNGLYNVNISNTLGKELTLEAPEVVSDELIELSGSSYLLQVMYPFGVINFIFELRK